MEKAGACRTPERELRGVACGRQQGDEGGGGVFLSCYSSGGVPVHGWLPVRGRPRAFEFEPPLGTYAMRVARVCA